LANQDRPVLLIDADGLWTPPPEWVDRVVDRHVWLERRGADVALSDPTSIASARPFGELQGVPARRRGPALAYCGQSPPLTSQRAIEALFRSLEQRYEIVVVNVPPFLSSAKAATVTAAAGRALVAVPNGASVTDYDELTRRLRLAAVLPIGYVYCARDPRSVVLPSNQSVAPPPPAPAWAPTPAPVETTAASPRTKSDGNGHQVDSASSVEPR
jgi:hypothetical protein